MWAYSEFNVSCDKSWCGRYLLFFIVPMTVDITVISDKWFKERKKDDMFIESLCRSLVRASKQQKNGDGKMFDWRKKRDKISTFTYELWFWSAEHPGWFGYVSLQKFTLRSSCSQQVMLSISHKNSVLVEVWHFITLYVLYVHFTTENKKPCHCSGDRKKSVLWNKNIIFTCKEVPDFPVLSSKS